MIYPFDKRYSITSTFQDHLNSGGVRAQVPANDYGTPVGTTIYAMMDCFIQREEETFEVDGVQYTNPILSMVADDGTRFDHRHVEDVLHDHEHVKQGILVGHTGQNGYCFGPHDCIAYRPDWISAPANYVDAAPLLDTLPLINTESMPTPNSSVYIVQPGDNLTRIAERFNIILSDLVKWNVGTYPTLATNIDHIESGWVLAIVPSTAPAIPTPVERTPLMTPAILAKINNPTSMAPSETPSSVAAPIVPTPVLDVKTLGEDLQTAGVYSATSAAVATNIGVLISFATNWPIPVIVAITGLITVGLNLLMVIIKKKLS